MQSRKLIVIGGGAAGFFCALNAARLNPDLKVIILEKSGKLLSKVRISGGGRCNVTHACFEIPEMIRNYPRGAHFLKKAFHQFFTTDTIEWFRERSVLLKTEPDGRMFPASNSSQTIIDCLMREANKHEVEICMNADVRRLRYEHEKFHLELAKGAESSSSFSGSPELVADYVCIAAGGYPKTAMFDWLGPLGHGIEAPVPSLFTFNTPSHPLTQLMGVSVPQASVKIHQTSLIQKGPILITHWGLSGPAVLKLSAWGARELAQSNWQFSAQVNWLTAFNEQSLRQAMHTFRSELSSQKISSRNPLGLPQRLWEFLVAQSGIDAKLNWADMSSTGLQQLISNLVAYTMTISGKTTFKEEFVTAGGVKLSEIDANTMMSKKVPDLFFAGEIMDVDGVTGGFNFQHAWTSGFVAGRSIAMKAK